MVSSNPRWALDGRPAGRPPIGLIIGLVLAALCAAASLSFDLLNGGPVNFAIALALALAPLPLLLAAVLTLDRLEPEPRTNLAFAFFWGAGVAVLFAGLLNAVGWYYLVKGIGLDKATAKSLAITFGAPPVEETLKGLALIGLLRWRRQEIDGPTDGIIYASMVGLGFAMTENVGYYVASLIKGGTGELLVTVVLRGLLSPFAHPLFTSMIGLGIAYAAIRNGRGRIAAILVGWVAAMLLHMLWNGMVTYFQLPGLGIAYLVLLAILGVLITVIIVERRRLVRMIQDYLPIYQVGIEELNMLSSLRTRQLARHWARVKGGMRAARAMSDYQLAATELVLLHQRWERGVIAKDAFDVQQAGLVALMKIAQREFPSGGPLSPS